MNEDIIRKLEDQDKKIEAIWISVEKTRKYFLATIIATVVMTVLPLIGIAIAIPFFLSALSGQMEGLL